jgi:hypothetical protein
MRVIIHATFRSPIAAVAASMMTAATSWGRDSSDMWLEDSTVFFAFGAVATRVAFVSTRRCTPDR